MIYEDILLAGIIIGFSVLLFILADIMERYPHSLWKALFALPLVISMIIAAVKDIDFCMLGVYAGAFILLFGFFKNSTAIRRRVCVASIILAATSMIICNVSKAYRAVDYVKEFKEAFKELEKNYCLTWHKGIDFDALYEEYLPIFEEAKREHDSVKNAAAWVLFSEEFNDSHVYYQSSDEATYNEALKLLYGNDYGFSMLSYSDGGYALVNVDASLLEKGITNGTRITKWNGEDIASYVSACELKVSEFAYKENIEFYKPVAAAGGKGGAKNGPRDYFEAAPDTVTITYIGSEGEEITETFTSLGAYSERCRGTIDRLDSGVRISSLDYKDIDAETSLLRLSMMIYDYDSMMSEDYSSLSNQVEQALSEKKEAGVKNLIIDLRSNGGGSSKYVEVFTRLLAPEGEHVYACDGVYNRETSSYEMNPDGTYKIGGTETYKSTGLGQDMNIVVLVNAYTGSAGDHMTYLLSAFPNVTVMGYTRSSTSSQGVGGITLSEGELSYSKILVLNEDGTVFLDSDKNGVSSVPLDIKVSVDEEMIRNVFDYERDYLLDLAVKQLEK